MASQLFPPSLPLFCDPNLVLVADLVVRPGLAPAGHPHPLPPQPPPVLGEVGVVDVQQQDHPSLLTAVDHLDKEMMEPNKKREIYIFKINVKTKTKKFLKNIMF